MFIKIEEKEVASTEIVYGGEILPDGTVQVRKCTISKDVDGNQIGKAYHRHVIHPGDDYSNEPAEVQIECQREHTIDKINARAAFLEEQEAKLNG